MKARWRDNYSYAEKSTDATELWVMQLKAEHDQNVSHWSIPIIRILETRYSSWKQNAHFYHTGSLLHPRSRQKLVGTHTMCYLGVKTVSLNTTVTNDELLFAGLSQLGVCSKSIHVLLYRYAKSYQPQAHSLHCGRDGSWARLDTGTRRESCPCCHEVRWAGGTEGTVPLTCSSYGSSTAIPKATQGSLSLHWYP